MIATHASAHKECLRDVDQRHLHAVADLQRVRWMIRTAIAVQRIRIVLVRREIQRRGALLREERERTQRRHGQRRLLREADPRAVESTRSGAASGRRAS